MELEAEEQFLRFNDALKLFAGSASTLRRRIADGSIPIRQFGGEGTLVEIPLSALKATNQRQRSEETLQGKPKEKNSIQIPGPIPKWRK